MAVRVRRGTAGYGAARCGKVRHGSCGLVRQGMVRLGPLRSVMAVKVRLVEFRSVMACSGKAGYGSRGTLGHVKVWFGAAR